MSFYNALLSAAQSQHRVQRHVSKTAKALARSAFDSVDVNELLDYDEDEVLDMQETHERYAQARHDF
jgi:predicted esterase YcpF (UPF0227 family)